MKVFWTPYAKKSLHKTVDFLSVQWDDEIIDHFLGLIDKRLDHVKMNPQIAPKIKSTQYRKLLIHKHVSLFYVNEKKIIKVLLIWDNRQDPDDLYKELTTGNT